MSANKKRLLFIGELRALFDAHGMSLDKLLGSGLKSDDGEGA